MRRRVEEPAANPEVRSNALSAETRASSVRFNALSTLAADFNPPWFNPPRFYPPRQPNTGEPITSRLRPHPDH